MIDTRMQRAALAAVLISFAAAAGAQSTAQQPAAGASAGAAKATATGRDVARGDRQFLEHAAAGGMAEVALGNMAKERASNPQVRQFGERMVQDHTGANQEVTRLAVARGVGTPAESDRRQRRSLDKLSQLKGAEFDREFMKAMVDDHERTVELFEKQSRSGDDAELKAFATKTLPTLRDHLQAARALHDTVAKAR
ncbi:hypothetical protein CKO44_01100 [Rubrivivax gelatinosus]|uniref:DUF4142 domain-containing protein n=1 Tax=Rubrivivax gelatinosus TaxID=28068 RepID=A0ABS1DNS7_RUBGE|nr:DUF4142 domain-containing protein [Rubrivivax gelatinosus]MBK1612068.1 hypothetical protein [Rubrivivax gelatinosus]MBK1711371.1 hypothetical protein [Rubrivivax gelatinosus]